MLLLSKGYFIYASQCPNSHFEFEGISPTAEEQVATSSYIQQMRFVLTQVDHDKTDISKLMENKHIQQRLNFEASDDLFTGKQPVTQETAKAEYEKIMADWRKALKEEIRKYGGR